MAVSPKDLQDYFVGLGMFMHEFSRMENHMNAILADYIAWEVAPNNARASDILKATTGGLRFAVLRDTLKRVMRVAGSTAEQNSRVSDLFTHMGEVQFVRDKLAHNGADVIERDGKIWVETDNVFTVHEREKREVVSFGIDVFDDLTYDADIAPVCLYKIITPEGMTVFENMGSYPEVRSSDIPPWKFKPSSLVRRRPGKDSTPR